MCYLVQLIKGHRQMVEISSATSEIIIQLLLYSIYKLWCIYSKRNWQFLVTCRWYALSGAVFEEFLRFPETTQDFPSMMGAPLFGYNVSRGVHSGLNSGVTGFCFYLNLRKCSEDLFFLVTTKENWRPSQKFVLQRHWKLCAKIPPYASATNRLFGNYSAKSLEPPLCIILFKWQLSISILIQCKKKFLPTMQYHPNTISIHVYKVVYITRS